MIENKKDENELETKECLLPVPQYFWGSGIYGMTIRIPNYRKERGKLSSKILYYCPLNQCWSEKNQLRKVLKRFGLSFIDWECLWIFGMSTSEIGTVKWALKKIETYYSDKPENTKTYILMDLLRDPYKEETFVFLSKIDFIDEYYKSREGDVYTIDYDFSCVPTYLCSPREKVILEYDDTLLGQDRKRGQYITDYYTLITEKKDTKELMGNKLNKLRSLGTEVFIKRSIEFFGEGKYDYSKVRYINNWIPVEIVCLKCGNSFKKVPHLHMTGAGCPICELSTGEINTEMYLISNNIKFKHNIRVDLVEKLIYPDFVLEDENIWIEYNGEQHYRYVNIFHDHSRSRSFVDQLERDIQERKYCKKNNIILIEIPYIFDTRKKVFDFLDKVLIQHINPNTLVNYSELYKLDDTGLSLEDLLLSS